MPTVNLMVRAKRVKDYCLTDREDGRPKLIVGIGSDLSVLKVRKPKNRIPIAIGTARQKTESSKNEKN